MLVPLRGAAEDAAVRGARALELACWCCCSVPLQGAVLKRRVRFGVGMLVPLQGAVAGCCCQSVRFGASVLLQGAAVWSSVYPVELACTVPLQGAGGGYYCQRAVCILGTWVLLQGVAVRVRCVLCEAWVHGVAARGWLRDV